MASLSKLFVIGHYYDSATYDNGLYDGTGDGEQVFANDEPTTLLNLGVFLLESIALASGYSNNPFVVKDDAFSISGLASKLYELTMDEDILVSRAELMRNGDAHVGDKSNFSEWDSYVATGGPSGGPYFSETSGSVSRFTDDYELIDPSRSYTIKHKIKRFGPGATRFYSGLSCFDSQQRFINNHNVNVVSGSAQTTLGADLDPGDSTITLTSGTGWYDGPTGHQRNIRFGNYVDENGETYGTHGYSRLIDFSSSGQWAEGGISGTTITLSSTWSGPSYAAGTPVANAQSGSTYNYTAASNQVTPTSWTEYSGTISPEPAVWSGTSAELRPGTRYVKGMFLMNRNAGSAETTGVVDMSLQLAGGTDAGIRSMDITTPKDETLTLLDELAKQYALLGDEDMSLAVSRYLSSLKVSDESVVLVEQRVMGVEVYKSELVNIIGSLAKDYTRISDETLSLTTAQYLSVIKDMDTEAMSVAEQRVMDIAINKLEAISLLDSIAKQYSLLFDEDLDITVTRTMDVVKRFIVFHGYDTATYGADVYDAATDTSEGFSLSGVMTSRLIFALFASIGIDDTLYKMFDTAFDETLALNELRSMASVKVTDNESIGFDEQSRIMDMLAVKFENITLVANLAMQYLLLFDEELDITVTRAMDVVKRFIVAQGYDVASYDMDAYDSGTDTSEHFVITTALTVEFVYALFASIGLTDSIVKSFYSPKEETLGVTDVYSNTPIKNLVELAMSVNEARTMAVGKSLNETIDILVTLVNSFGITFEEGVAASEIRRMLFVKRFVLPAAYDQATYDEDAYDLSEDTSEGVIVNDITFSVEFLLELLENLGLEDMILKTFELLADEEVSVDELRTLLVTKPLDETVALTGTIPRFDYGRLVQEAVDLTGVIVKHATHIEYASLLVEDIIRNTALKALDENIGPIIDSHSYIAHYTALLDENPQLVDTFTQTVIYIRAYQENPVMVTDLIRKTPRKVLNDLATLVDTLGQFAVEFVTTTVEDELFREYLVMQLQTLDGMIAKVTPSFEFESAMPDE